MALVKTTLGGEDFNGTFSKINPNGAVVFTSCTAVSGLAVNVVRPLADFVDPITATTLNVPASCIVSAV